MTTEKHDALSGASRLTDVLGVLRIGQKPIDCGSVELSVSPRNIGVFGEAGGKHIAIVAAYVVCVLVVGNGPLEAYAPPERNDRPMLVDSGQELRVATEGNLSKRAIGIFSEVEKNGVESVTVDRSGLLMPLDSRWGVNSDKHHSESAGASKKPSGVSDDSGERVQGYVMAIAIGMWVGLFASWVIRLLRYMSSTTTPN